MPLKRNFDPPSQLESVRRAVIDLALAMHKQGDGEEVEIPLIDLVIPALKPPTHAEMDLNVRMVMQDRRLKRAGITVRYERASTLIVFTFGG